MTIESDKPGTFMEVGLTVPLSIQEAVCNYIIENLAGGLVIEDEKQSGTIGLKFYLPGDTGPEFKNDLARYIKSADVDIDFSSENITTKIVREVEWVQAYRNSIKPVHIDEVVVRPPWEKVTAGNKIELVIEPKMAFGTGHHETTVLCIRAIAENLKRGDSFFDLGCGSGILSILAAKLGAVKIKGVDIDSTAVENARENIILNSVENKIDIELGSIELADENKPYDFLVANLIRETILSIYNRIFDAVEKDGVIVLSGLLSEDEEAVSNMLNNYEISQYQIRQDGQWLAYIINK